MKRMLTLLSIANLLGSLGWSLYYSVSRPYYTFVLGATYTLILIIASSEWLPGLTSFLWGYLSDRYGSKKVLVLGVLAFSLSLTSIVKLNFIPIVVGLASLGWASAWPVILAGVTRISGEHVGRGYGFFAVGSSIGWGLGGIVAGVLAEYISIRGVLAISGILAGTAYVIAYIILRGYDWRYSPTSFSAMMKGPILFVALSCIILTVGIDYAFNLISVQLYYEVDENLFLYGLFLTSIPAFVGAIIRPVAGIIADMLGGLRTVLLSITMYIAVYLFVAILRGLYLALLWIIPVYPFYDTGFIRLASEVSSKDKRGTAMGVINTSMSIAGSSVFLLGPLTDIIGFANGMILAAIIAFSSIIPLAVLRKRLGS